MFGLAGVFFGILVGWIVGSQQGAAPRPATPPAAERAATPGQPSAAPLDESRAASLLQTAERDPATCGYAWSSATCTSTPSASRMPRAGTSRRSKSIRRT